MRILAVRGRNLASLAEFEVSLDDKSPLGQAGIFAITGPTGAGKSTLLDAMCLALYGRLPRVRGERGGYRVADDENASAKDALPVTDVRHIIQRGAAEAFAEVVFLGCDNHRWRARWSVRRARGKANGKLQNAKVELFASPDAESKTEHRGEDAACSNPSSAVPTSDAQPKTEHCGGEDAACSNLPSADPTSGARSKTEHRSEDTRRLIVEKVGLTYEQFCRSVLLAQGDFAAFLRADADERAQILEALTDTQLYARLSQAAHRRAAEEKAKLAALEAEAGGLQPLSETERAAAEDEKRSLEARRRHIVAEQKAYEAARQWYARRDALEEALRRAEDDHAAAVQARRAADAEADRLGRLERAEALRHVAERRRRARAAEEQADAQQTNAAAALDAARQAFEAAQSRARQAEERLRAVQTECDAKQPEIEQARILDVQIAETNRRHSEAAHRRAEAACREHEACAALEQAVLEQAEVDEDIAEADRWLVAHNHLEALVAQRALWEREIAAYAEAGREIARLSDEETRLGAALRALADKLDPARQAVADANAALETAKAELISTEEAVAALQAAQSPAARRELRRQLDERRKTLEDLARLREAAVKAEADRAAAEAEARLAAETRTQLEQQHAELTAERKSLEAAQQAREGELRLAQATEALAARRPDLLFPGKPCPLCGSTEHPDAAKPAPPSELVARVKAELDAARRALAACEAEIRRIERRIAAEATKAEAAEARATDAEALRRSQDARWATLRPSDVPASPLEADVQAILDAALARLAAESGKLDEAENAYEAARAARDQAQNAVNALGEQVRTAQNGLQRLETEQRRLETERARLCAQRESQVARRRQALQASAPAFARQTDWPAALEANAEVFLEQAKALVTAWEAATQTKQALLTRRSNLERDVAARRSAYAAARTAHAQAETELAAVAAELAQHRQARAALLDGRRTEDVAKALDDALQAAHRRLDEARQQLTEAQSRKVAAETALNAAQTRRADTAREAAEAAAALDAALAADGLDEDELSTLLSVPAAERESLKSRLQALDKVLAAAQGALESKRRELAAHLSSSPPDTPQADVEARLKALDEEISRHDQQLGALDERLRRDDDLRRRFADLAARIAPQRADHQVWAELDDVIGSADGKKFRLFVQSLHFQILLEHANHYLEQLRQRYRLAPVKGAELELQVIDRAMADAVRPVTTLSGGETFLVSLALALGLSAMSADKVTIQSLFIDEGFGTLDQQSLDVALGMLEQLKEEGRHIGIISHIPELSERIGHRIAVTPNGRGVSQVSIIGGPKNHAPAAGS